MIRAISAGIDTVSQWRNVTKDCFATFSWVSNTVPYVTTRRRAVMLGPTNSEDITMAFHTKSF